MIRAWLKRRAAAERAKRYDQGFSWAAGRLLHGDPFDQVESWAIYGYDFDGPNAWDDGIIGACKAWEARQ